MNLTTHLYKETLVFYLVTRPGAVTGHLVFAYRFSLFERSDDPLAKASSGLNNKSCKIQNLEHKNSFKMVNEKKCKTFMFSFQISVYILVRLM